LFTAPYGNGAVDFAGGGAAAIPSFDAGVCRKFFVDHGLAVRAIAIQVSSTTVFTGFNSNEYNLKIRYVSYQLIGTIHCIASYLVPMKLVGFPQFYKKKKRSNECKANKVVTFC
jgi:hypothetical protein